MAHEPTNRIRAEQRPPQRQKVFNATNRFDYDQSKVPVGYKYEWKAEKVAGAENEERMIQCEMNGWENVPAGRHVELVGQAKAKAEPTAPIRRGGQRLMQIPIEYYEESKQLDQFEAQHTVESQIARLGVQGRQNGGARGGVGRTRGPVDINMARRRSGEGEIVE